jgi:hypothetical protein
MKVIDLTLEANITITSGPTMLAGRGALVVIRYKS